MVLQMPILQPTRFYIKTKKKLDEDTRHLFKFVLGALTQVYGSPINQSQKISKQLLTSGNFSKFCVSSSPSTVGL